MKSGLARSSLQMSDMCPVCADGIVKVCSGCLYKEYICLDETSACDEFICVRCGRGEEDETE